MCSNDAQNSEDYATYRAAVVAIVARCTGWPIGEVAILVGDCTEAHAEALPPALAAADIIDATMRSL